MKKENVKIIFFGTPEFAAHTLRELFENEYNVAGVVTKSGSPVQRAAEQKSVAVFGFDDLKKREPHIGILFAYGKIVPKAVLDIFPKGILNIHPSWLPKYRGSSPVQTALFNGDKKTGVSIIVLDEEIDHGPIVAHEEVAIMQDERADELYNRLSIVGTKLLIDILPDYLNGKIIPQKQMDSYATFTKTIERKDGKVDWSKSADEIYNQFRAFYPWPGIFSYWGKKRLKLLKLSLDTSAHDNNKRPGQVFKNAQGFLCVQCAQGVIVLHKLQLEGKKEIVAIDFILGYNSFVGSFLS